MISDVKALADEGSLAIMVNSIYVMLCVTWVSDQDTDNSLSGQGAASQSLHQNYIDDARSSNNHNHLSIKFTTAAIHHIRLMLGLQGVCSRPRSLMFNPAFHHQDACQALLPERLQTHSHSQTT